MGGVGVVYTVGRGLAPAAGFAVNYGTGKLKCERRGRRLGAPFVGANCVRPPACHSEPTGEESRFAQVYFALLEILRFAQDDKLGVAFSTVGAGFHARPLVILSR